MRDDYEQVLETQNNFKETLGPLPYSQLHLEPEIYFNSRTLGEYLGYTANILPTVMRNEDYYPQDKSEKGSIIDLFRIRYTGERLNKALWNSDEQRSHLEYYTGLQDDQISWYVNQTVKISGLVAVWQLYEHKDKFPYLYNPYCFRHFMKEIISLHNVSILRWTGDPTTIDLSNNTFVYDIQTREVNPILRTSNFDNRVTSLGKNRFRNREGRYLGYYFKLDRKYKKETNPNPVKLGFLFTPKAEFIMP